MSGHGIDVWECVLLITPNVETKEAMQAFATKNDVSNGVEPEAKNNKCTSIRRLIPQRSPASCNAKDAEISLVQLLSYVVLVWL